MCVERPSITPMSVDHPSARLFKDDRIFYVTGGKGNAQLIGWSRGTQEEKENAVNYRPSLSKKFNHNHSLNVVPVTINKRGRIIRYKSYN